MAKQITYHRVYEETSPKDGKRILVDRVWPRGMHKEDARLDEWLRDVAPSSELRRWYGHEPSRFAEFRRRYLSELKDAGHRQAAEHLRELAVHDRPTLLTATKDVDHSQAVVLAEWLAKSRDEDARGPQGGRTEDFDRRAAGTAHPVDADSSMACQQLLTEAVAGSLSRVIWHAQALSWAGRRNHDAWAVSDCGAIPEPADRENALCPPSTQPPSGSPGCCRQPGRSPHGGRQEVIADRTLSHLSRRPGVELIAVRVCGRPKT